MPHTCLHTCLHTCPHMPAHACTYLHIPAHACPENHCSTHVYRADAPERLIESALALAAQVPHTHLYICSTFMFIHTSVYKISAQMFMHICLRTYLHACTDAGFCPVPHNTEVISSNAESQSKQVPRTAHLVYNILIITYQSNHSANNQNSSWHCPALRA